jgi:hypothetical protein
MRFLCNGSSHGIPLAAFCAPRRYRVQMLELSGVFLITLSIMVSGCDEEGEDKSEEEGNPYTLDPLFDCTGGKLGSVDDPTLCWQNPTPAEAMTWQAAMAYCEALVVEETDDWRLPSIDELRTIIFGCGATAPGGSCGVRPALPVEEWEVGCAGCASLKGPSPDGCYTNKEFEKGCKTRIYFTSSSAGTGDLLDDTRYPIHVRFDTAAIGATAETAHLRCVRTVGSGK